MYSVYQLLSYFIIYAFFGWCLEVVYQAVDQGKFINRGFLNGPYCPIYGFGVIAVIGSLTPIMDNLLILFAGSVLLATLLELITGFFLEKIFHQKWWDYSDEKFNFKGYICLKFSLLWGVACLIVVRLIHPIIEKFVLFIPSFLGRILLIIIYAGFLSDVIITLLAVKKIRKRMIILEGLSAEMRKISDYTGEKLFDKVVEIRERSEEISEKNEERKKRLAEIKLKYKTLSEKKKGFNYKRIEHAFPKLDLKAHIEERLNQKNDKSSD